MSDDSSSYWQVPVPLLSGCSLRKFPNEWITNFCQAHVGHELDHSELQQNLILTPFWVNYVQSWFHNQDYANAAMNKSPFQKRLRLLVSKTITKKFLVVFFEKSVDLSVHKRELIMGESQLLCQRSPTLSIRAGGLHWSPTVDRSAKPFGISALRRRLTATSHHRAGFSAQTSVLGEKKKPKQHKEENNPGSSIAQGAKGFSWAWAVIVNGRWLLSGLTGVDCD